MVTYLIFKEFIYDILWLDLFCDGGCIAKALVIVSTPFYILYGLICLLVDILFIPFYIIIGIIALIIKFIEVLRGD